MKKIISIVLAVMLVVSVAAVSAGAYNNVDDYSKMSPGNVYNPSDSYTVDANTPYCEDAIQQTGGDLSETQKIYFQAPENWANKFNTFEGPDDSEPYPHYCGYWWDGIGTDWSSVGGGSVKWCGYQAHLVDKANRIYVITLPNDGDSSTLVINNGINGGMDTEAEIFSYAQQWTDLNTEGAAEGEYETLPEGSPTQDDFDGCIAIVDYNKKGTPSELTGMSWYGANWFVYYGNGCYGNYPQTSANFHGRTASCVNPEHHHAMAGDVNNDKVLDVEDVLMIQEHLAHIHEFTESTQLDAADADGDNYVSIIDATRIQRYLAKMCNMDGSKPYKEDAE